MLLTHCFSRSLFSGLIALLGTSAAAEVVINEVYYDMPGQDVAEYIELYNGGTTAESVAGWSVLLVDGQTGDAADTIVLPEGATVPAGGYYLIGNLGSLQRYGFGKPNLDYSLDDRIQDGLTNGTGAPDAIVLRDKAGVRRDSLAWEADGRFFTGPLTADALAEGGTGRVFSRRPDSSLNVVLGRMPNGQDTGRNLQDFASMRPSPGAENKPAAALPLRDGFEEASPAWSATFADEVKRVDPTGVAKPGNPSPDGGLCLEVFDPKGGGDGAFITGAWDKLNFEGWLWLPAVMPADRPGWSLGVGIGTRMDAGWFSPRVGESIENGFYLEFQNGRLSADYPGLRRSTAAAPPTLRFLAVDASRTINTGEQTGSIVTVLGSSKDYRPAEWNKFRLVFDRPANRLAAFVNGKALYDGPFPTGNHNRTGGVMVGYREYDVPTAGLGEGLWLDGAVLDANTGPVPSLPAAGS